MRVIETVQVMNAIKMKPEDIEVSEQIIQIMIESGYLLGCAGMYPQAETCFRAILALHPERIGGWLGLGNVLMMRGNLDESEEAYEMVLQADPSDPAARAFLGELYLCTHRIEEGREILESRFPLIIRTFPSPNHPPVRSG